MTDPLAPAPPPTAVAEERSALRAVAIFPMLVLAAGVIGYFFAEPLSGLAGFINPMLGLIMFGMGLTLRLPDFTLVITRPLPVLLGVLAQYAVMPLAGLAVATALNLPDELTVGVVLVGCVPGGTASNVVAYLARADVALSVTMTSISTLLAPIVTPLLTLWLVGARLPVDAAGMAVSMVQIVLVPVILGLLIFTGALTIIGNLLADIAYALVDPRVKLEA